MKNLFPWKFTPSEADFYQLWQNAIFVFDTNFLLDLYRVSFSTADDTLKILEQIQDRIWLPYQVASEFLDNREKTIDSEAESFKQALEKLEKWKTEQKNFNNLRQYFKDVGRIVFSEVEFLFDQQEKYISIIEEVAKVFQEKIEKVSRNNSLFNINEDKILERILSLFKDKVGEKFTRQDLQKLYKEAEDRYKQSIPPGYKDTKGKDDERKYGDFIVWRQILNFAKKESRPIIFVTSEKKEDWWDKKNGKITSPNTKLRQEFHEDVQQIFWMYRTQYFLKMAREKLMVEIKPKSIEETTVIAESEFLDELNQENFKQATEQIELLKSVRKNLEKAGISASEVLEIRQPLITLQQALEKAKAEISRSEVLEIGQPHIALQQVAKDIKKFKSDLQKMNKQVSRFDSELQQAIILQKFLGS